MALSSIQTNNKLIKFREEVIREFVRAEYVLRLHGELDDLGHPGLE